MAPDSKSTSFGLSYLIALAFRRKSRHSKRYSRKTTTIYSNADFSDSDWTFASYGSSQTSLSAYSVQTSKPEIEGQGLCIRFASSSSVSGSSAVPKPLSPMRATRLKYRIANAVVKAGMDAGAEAAADPLDSALRQRGALPPAPPESSCYRGTYGQVMQALQSAGLTATPCNEAGFPNATRLGAMFVLNHSRRSGGMELMKVTLWA